MSDLLPEKLDQQEGGEDNQGEGASINRKHKTALSMYLTMAAVLSLVCGVVQSSCTPHLLAHGNLVQEEDSNF